METREFVFDPQNPTGYAQALEEVLVDLTDPQNPVRSVDKAFTVGLDVISQALANAVTGLAAKEPGTFIYDGHGSVRMIADKVGDAVQIALREVGSQDEVKKIDYEAYGEAINAAISTALTQLLYSGEFTDAINNNQYLRARYYDIASGRFSRVDPFAGNFQVPQSLNKYLYAHGDPIAHTDPSGEAIPALLAIIAVHAVVNFIAFTAIATGFNMPRGDDLTTAFQKAIPAGLVGAGFAIPIVNIGLGAVMVVLLGKRIASGNMTGLDYAELAVFLLVGGTTSKFAGKAKAKWSTEVSTNTMANNVMTSRAAPARNAAVLEQFNPREGNGFTGVFDPATGNMAIRPSGATVRSNGDVPRGRVGQGGGHAEVANQHFAGQSGLWGFSLSYNAAGGLRVGWNSGQLNIRANNAIGRGAARDVAPSVRPALLQKLAETLSRSHESFIIKP